LNSDFSQFCEARIYQFACQPTITALCMNSKMVNMPTASIVTDEDCSN